MANFSATRKKPKQSKSILPLVVVFGIGILTIGRIIQLNSASLLESNVVVNELSAFVPDSQTVEEHKPPTVKAVEEATELQPQSQPDDTSTPPRLVTDAGVDVSDPELYTGEDLHGDSSTATVMGLATGYNLGVFERFVGTLRKSGFKGHIILGVAPDVPELTLAYFEVQNVTTKVLQWVDCQYDRESTSSKVLSQDKTCVHPYIDIKSRWSRFPLQRDWLEQCETCTGPVLVMDVRDSFFQRDPFGPGSPKVEGLQVFEEHKNQTTSHWLTNWPINNCKKVRYKETMLCSGTTIGTRKAMMKYLEVMHQEMRSWIQQKECRFDIHGDDQSIHNHLFYSGQLPFATAIPNRIGIVHTVGYEAAKLWKAKNNYYMTAKGFSKPQAGSAPFLGATPDRWLGPDTNLIDDDGYILDFDGSRSRVIHQFDRFGKQIMPWMHSHGINSDPVARELIKNLKEKARGIKKDK